MARVARDRVYGFTPHRRRDKRGPDSVAAREAGGGFLARSARLFAWQKRTPPSVRSLQCRSLEVSGRGLACLISLARKKLLMKRRKSLFTVALFAACATLGNPCHLHMLAFGVPLCVLSAACVLSLV